MFAHSAYDIQASHIFFAYSACDLHILSLSSAHRPYDVHVPPWFICMLCVLHSFITPFLFMLCVLHPWITPFLCVLVDWFSNMFSVRNRRYLSSGGYLLGSFWALLAVLGNYYHPLGPRCDFRSIFNDGRPKMLPPFCNTFGTLFGTWASHDAFFIVLLTYFFKALFFIDFGRPKGSKINAFWRWSTWLKCGK